MRTISRVNMIWLQNRTTKDVPNVFRCIYKITASFKWRSEICHNNLLTQLILCLLHLAANIIVYSVSSMNLNHTCEYIFDTMSPVSKTISRIYGWSIISFNNTDKRKTKHKEGTCYTFSPHIWNVPSYNVSLW